MKHFFQISLKPLTAAGTHLPQKGYEADDTKGARPELIALEKALAVIPEPERKNYVANIAHMGTIDG